MAKSKSKNSKSKKQSAEDAERKAAKKARTRASALASEAKDLRKAADKAVAKAEKAERKATGARAAAGLSVPAEKPDEAELLRLALRSAEARLVDAEHRLRLAQQELDDERRLRDEAADEVLEDAVVDAAIEATVTDAIVDAVADAQLEGDAVTDAEIVEAVAIDLDGTAEEADTADREPSHEGDAEDAAEVFAESDPAAEPELVATEITPPLPDAPADGTPNESWTLVRLREEARSRGLTGISNLPKATLLDRLRAG